MGFYGHLVIGMSATHQLLAQGFLKLVGDEISKEAGQEFLRYFFQL